MRDYCRQLGWLKIEDGEFKQNELRSRYRPHRLRMSFSTILKSKNVAALHVEHMLGHSAAYNGAYDVVTEADLFETYKRAEKYLSIRPEPSKELESIEALRKELEIRNGKISVLEEKITALETREEGRAPYDDKMTKLMKRLIANPEIKELIKKELGEVKDEKH